MIKIAIIIKIKLGLIIFIYSFSCSGEETLSNELFRNKFDFPICTPPEIDVCDKCTTLLDYKSNYLSKLHPMAIIYL